MCWGAVAMIVYFVLMAVVLHFTFPADVKTIDGAGEFIAQRKAELGPWTPGQRNSLIVFIVAVVLWIMPGILGIVFGPDSQILTTYNTFVPESVVAMVAALLLFIMPTDLAHHEFTMTWDDAVHGVDWGTLILFGGGLSLGAMMYSTGLSEWIGGIIVSSLGGSPSEIMLVGTFCVLALVMSELTSHTAATNMVGPLGITTALAAGFSPIPVAVGIALSASLGFMLPVSTPPNAIVYASGYVPITKMIRTGFIIDVVGVLAVTIPLATFVVKWVCGI